MNPIQLPGLVTLGDEKSWATFSPCDQYRYLLGRCWEKGLPILGVDMMNPSSASHEKPDKTIDKCMLLAKQEGFGGLLVRNISAYRSTDPKALLTCMDPIGPRNREILEMNLTMTRVMAWGRIPGPIAKRLQRTLWRAERRCTHVFQWTDKPPLVGRHPLYLKNATRLIPIEREAAQ